MGDGESHESDVAQADERLPESVPETAFADGTVSTAASAIASVARPAQVKGSASPPAAPHRPGRRIRASEALALQRTAGNAATVRLLLRDKQRPTAAQQPLMPTKSTWQDLLDEGEELAAKTYPWVGFVAAVGKSLHMRRRGRDGTVFAWQVRYRIFEPGIYLLAEEGAVRLMAGGRSQRPHIQFDDFPELQEKIERKHHKLYLPDWTQMSYAEGIKVLGPGGLRLPMLILVGDAATMDDEVPPPSEPVEAPLPRLPSRIIGLDQQVLQATGTYSMDIAFWEAGPTLMEQVTSTMQKVNYQWQIWKLDKPEGAAASLGADMPGAVQRVQVIRRADIPPSGAKAPTPPPADPSKDVPPTNARTVGDWDAYSLNTARRWNEYLDHADQYVNDADKAAKAGDASNYIANVLNMALFVPEGIGKVGGQLLDTVAAALGDKRSVELPMTEEGVFVLRCKAELDPDTPRARDTLWHPPSVATFAVAVRNLMKAGEYNLEKEELELAYAELRGALAGDLDSAVITRGNEAAARRRHVVSGVILIARQKMQDQIDQRVTTSPFLKAGLYDSYLEGLRTEQQRIETWLTLARRRESEMYTGGPDRLIHRMQAHLTSSASGIDTSLLLEVNEPLRGSDDLYHCKLADVTNEDATGFPEGKGATREAAVWDACTQIAGTYPDGVLTVRLPESFQKPQLTKQFRTTARNWSATKERVEELIKILALVALVGGTLGAGAGVAAAVIGAAAAAANLILRARAGTLRADAALVGDVIAVLQAAAPLLKGASVVIEAGKGETIVARVFGERFVLFATKAGEAAQIAGKFDEAILSKAALLWGDVNVITQLNQIDDEERSGGSSIAATRKRFDILTNQIVATHMGFLTHGGDRAPDEEPPGGEKKPPSGKRDEPPAPKRDAPPAPKRDEPPAPKRDEPPPAAKRDQPPASGGKDIPPPALPELPPASGRETPVAPALDQALRTGRIEPGAHAQAVIKATGGWTSRLRAVVDKLPPQNRAAAETALNRARELGLKAQYDAAARRYVVEPFDVGTAGFRSDIDVTMYPRELSPGFKGTPRDPSEQIKASALAAQSVANGLRRRFGGDPEVTLDVAVHAYIGEDIAPARPDEAARKAAAALETEVAFAELRRGSTDAQWAEIRRTLEAGLPVGPDVPDAVAKTNQAAREELAAALKRAEDFKTRMDNELGATIKDVIGPEAGRRSDDEIATAARDQLLLAKRLKLADLFGWTPRDWPQIERLQAEIRWLSPGAYAGAAAFQYTVRHGQARKAAANVAKSFAERAAENRSVAERQNELTSAIASHLAMLQKHLHDASAPVKDALKYAGRALEMVEESGASPPQDLIPRLLREFKQSRWGDGDPAAIQRILGEFGEQIGYGEFVHRDADGTVTKIDEPLPWVLVDRINRWMVDQLAAQARKSATIGDHGWTPAPEPPHPPPSVTPDPLRRLSAGLSQPAVERLSQVMTTEQALAIAGWLGFGRLEVASSKPADLRAAIGANDRLAPSLDDPAALRGLLRLTEETVPGRKAMSNAKILDIIALVPTDNLPAWLRVIGDPAFQHPQAYGRDPLIRLGQDTARLNFIGEFGYGTWGELGGSRPLWERLQERLAAQPDAAERRALVDALVAEPSTVARERMLGIERPPPRRPLTQAQANERDPAWKTYLSDAQRFMDNHAGLRGPRSGKAYGTGNERAIRAWATLLQVRDRITAAWADHQGLPQATKERILDQIDALGVQGDLITIWVNQVRGRVGEALYAPHGGIKQINIPNPLHPAASGRPGITRLDDRFEPGERPGSTSGVREWVEVKTDILDDSGRAIAKGYGADGLADWDGLLSSSSTRNDRIVIQFARRPPDGPTRQAMLAELFSMRSPFSAVRFGDEPWIERPSDRPMPPIRSELARGPLSSGNGSAGSSGAMPAGAPAGTTGSSAD